MVDFSPVEMVKVNPMCDVYQLRDTGSFLPLFIGVLDIPGCCFWISFINGIAHGY